MEATDFDIGVIVGRFQVDKLHPGHLSVIESVIRLHKRVVIFLGVAPTLITKNNPLDFVSRKEMILQQFPQVNVMPIPDMPSDVDWSNELDQRVRECCPIGSVLLYGGRDAFTKYYHGIFDTKILEPKETFSGTQIRLEVSREVKASQDFRSGAIYAAYNQYPKVFPTIDVAIIDKECVLLGRKKNSKKFRFPGGFSDPRDESYEEVVKREALEETGLRVENPEYIGSAKMNDWRYRNEEDKIITMFFKTKEFSGEAKASDDLEEVKWFEIKEITDELLVEEHRKLFKMLLDNLNK